MTFAGSTATLSESPGLAQQPCASINNRSSALHRPVLANTASFFVFGLSASYRFLFNVHQVTVDARAARKRRNDPVRVPVLYLLVSERLFVENVTVLHGNLAMEVRAHLVG